MIASMASWCTPIVLFCVSNLIIATLFISSKSSNTKTTKQHEHGLVNNNNTYSFGFTPRIPRVSSFLERAKSINISYIIPTIIIAAKLQPESPARSKTAKYTSLSRLAQSIFFSCNYDNQPDSPRYPSNKPKPTPSVLQRLKSIDFSSIYNINTTITESEDISKSPSQVVLDQVNSVKMSTHSKSEKGTPVKKAVVEVKKSRSEVRVVSDDEEEFDLRRPESVRARMNADDDVKAENFISKFRQQLKLQRLDSLGRYNDMLRRPS